MAARIAEHRARRGPFWRTVEAPLALAETIAAEATPDRPLLVDCLTLWLSNLMLAGRPLDREFADAVRGLARGGRPVVLVANEVGLGLVPETPLGREFRDAAGRLNQEIAALADRVVFVAAGLPLVLKEGLSRCAASPRQIVTGFLGAGKTAWCATARHALRYRLAIIVNEFGELGIDRELLLGCGDATCTDDDIVELANGCLCCTVADDFLPTLTRLIDRPDPPGHIVVETSGLALPKPLVQAFAWPEIRTRMTVDGVSR